jgi:hypothetical protein
VTSGLKSFRRPALDQGEDEDELPASQRAGCKKSPAHVRQEAG